MSDIESDVREIKAILYTLFGDKIDKLVETKQRAEFYRQKRIIQDAGSPADFYHGVVGKRLAERYETVKDVRAASDKEILSLKGVGKAALEDIRESAEPDVEPPWDHFSGLLELPHLLSPKWKPAFDKAMEVGILD